MGKKRSNGNSDALEDRKRKKRDEAPEALQKVKEEPEEKQGEGQEGLKKDDKKEEAKEEAKEEVKEELADVKEEENEEETRELDALLGDAVEVLTDRGLRRQQREEAAFQVKVDTDTEYEEPALTPFPEAVVIEGCSYEKVNGEYRIMPKPSRGRPSYCKPSSNKSMYLYWNPGKRWCIGFEFGSKKCVASVPDIGSLEPPVDPYPFHWKVVERHIEGGAKKDKHEKKLCVEMRAFSDEVKEMMKSFFMEEMYPPLEFDAKHLYEDSDDDLNTTIPPEETLEEKPEPETKAVSSKIPAASKSKPSKPKNQRQTRSSPKKAPAFAPPEDDEEAAMVMMAGQQSDSDDESKATAKATSSQPSDGDDSSVPDDSDGSSSSESSDEEPPDPDYQALGSKAQSIVNRLKSMPAEQAAVKFTKLFEIIRSKSRNGTLVPLTGCTASDMGHLAQWATRHLRVEDLWRAGRAPAPANGPRTPQEPQPHTPPVDEGSGHIHHTERPMVDVAAQLPHHTMAAPKSVLRRPGERGPVRRIRHSDQRHEVPVVSYKSCGEGLWFQCPGSLVNCDYCNRLVPQTMGSLQGAQGRPQFAQNLFLCQDCTLRT